MIVPSSQIIVIASLATMTMLAACADNSRSTKRMDGEYVEIANPASQRCAAEGGTHRAEQIDGHGQFGVCVFEDNRQCEEWALFRGHCPTGGVNVAGYATPAGRYCAITGGRYSVTQHSGTMDETGVCELPNGKRCEAAAYYKRVCN